MIQSSLGAVDRRNLLRLLTGGQRLRVVVLAIGRICVALRGLGQRGFTALLVVGLMGGVVRLSGRLVFAHIANRIARITQRVAHPRLGLAGRIGNGGGGRIGLVAHSRAHAAVTRLLGGVRDFLAHLLVGHDDAHARATTALFGAGDVHQGGGADVLHPGTGQGRGQLVDPGLGTGHTHPTRRLHGRVLAQVEGDVVMRGLLRVFKLVTGLHTGLP